MSTDKGEVTAMEFPTGSSMTAKPSFGARMKAHFKKWWWVHLIVFIVVFLVILLPVIFVGYPNIAQSQVNDSTLNITSMVIDDPTPKSFRLIQTQVLGSQSSFHPKIYSFLASVSLVGAAHAFTSVQVPETTSRDGVKINLDQTVDLSNANAFGDFAKAVMLQKDVELEISGKPELQQGSLPKTTVNYDKTVTMKGLNKLDGFNVYDVHTMNPPKNGHNLRGTVYIPNPTVMTITMGNVTLNLYQDGTLMGYSYINDLILKPGNNTLEMTAEVNYAKVLGLVLPSSTAKYGKTGIAPFTITGNSSVYNGQELPYFSNALAANNLTVDLNILAAI
ncbi:hypothetical protein N7539_002112 [Penicillium diatomitis]|uniref:Uncharacterized protein n=1 Tax=Penicillium diatomitis TaxID=2819901 RepID=A0A9W9XI07_9EURO|nr:uncharacterized protein N7539_002112 [Penicillium diatomitis]KAJ5493366.1 hypothetical protein N7539_002112 [Penicillium diatomitis]